MPSLAMLVAMLRADNIMAFTIIVGAGQISAREHVLESIVMTICFINIDYQKAGNLFQRTAGNEKKLLTHISLPHHLRQSIVLSEGLLSQVLRVSS